MGIKLNTAKQAYPMIYAYSTPQIAAHEGWTKIGYTEDQDVETRIKQQTHTSDTEARLEWRAPLSLMTAPLTASPTTISTHIFASLAWKTRKRQSGFTLTALRDVPSFMTLRPTEAF